MSERPIVSTRGQPPEEEKPDGVVLYDPTPREPLPSLEAPESPRSTGAIVAVLLLAAVALGGYQLFVRPSAPTNEPPTAPVLVPSGLDPVEAALIPVDGGFLRAEAGTTIELAIRARASGGA